MSFEDDIVGSGIVANLAQPGGNITGLSSLAPKQPANNTTAIETLSAT
jgi:ABC-type uncharacterized transport system substrate-binding protein